MAMPAGPAGPRPKAPRTNSPHFIQKFCTNAPPLCRPAAHMSHEEPSNKIVCPGPHCRKLLVITGARSLQLQLGPRAAAASPTGGAATPWGNQAAAAPADCTCKYGVGVWECRFNLDTAPLLCHPAAAELENAAGTGQAAAACPECRIAFKITPGVGCCRQGQPAGRVGLPTWQGRAGAGQQL